jgi:uncharacterized membrane protein
LLRLIELGKQPLWLDEATDAHFAARAFWNCVFAEHVHPPLYRALLHFVVSVFGDSILALRVLPAAFGTASVLVVGALARRVFPGSERYAMVLAAASPFLVFYSQENRNYSLFILLTLATTCAFLRFLEGDHGLLTYSFLSILLLYTHYMGIFVLGAHEVLYWLFGRRRALHWAVARIVAGLAFLPWLMWTIDNYRSESRLFFEPAWLIPVAIVRFCFGFGVAVFDASRNDTFLSNVLQEGPFLLLGLSVFGWLCWRGLGRLTNTTHRALAAYVFLFPWVVLVFFAPWVQLSEVRYLAFQAPFALILSAGGLKSLREPPRYVAIALLTVVVTASLTAYYAAPGSVLGYHFRFAKENWPGAAAIARDSNPDIVIVSPAYLTLPLSRYHLGSAQLTTSSQSVSGNWSDVSKIALVSGRTDPLRARLRAVIRRDFDRVAMQTFVSQNLIRVEIYQRRSLVSRSSRQ